MRSYTIMDMTGVIFILLVACAEAVSEGPGQPTS